MENTLRQDVTGRRRSTMSRLAHESRKCGFPSIRFVRHWYQMLTQTSERILQDELANRTGDLYIRSICFSPDGKFLATGAEDRQIRVNH